jgi:GT2 family glycosyltransferase
MHDLAIVTVSTNEAHWLRPCLTSIYAHAGSASIDVIVADNESTDGTRELVESEFPEARVVTCENRGFSHANNRGAMVSESRYVLFINPDTEIAEGDFGTVVGAMDERPEVGLAGVRQCQADGTVSPTIRRFPNAGRMLFGALGSERWPLDAPWLGERELRTEVYDREVSCDWTSGSFMLVRREALLAAGLLDERSFIYSEEPDLCLRIKQAGWDVRHLPIMTIIHHAGKAGLKPRIVAQDAYSRVQYAQKHFTAPHRIAYVSAMGLRFGLRALSRDPQKRDAYRHALATLVGREPPPFGPPPAVALAPLDERSRRDAERAVSDIAG